jgi:putative phosphoribosyl transferase
MAWSLFEDRADAGRRLADLLRPAPGLIVLGIPRGGVAVAREVATKLGAPLDVIVPRKLGAPRNPELGIGAVGPDGTVVLDDRTLRMTGADREYVEAEVERQMAEIARRSEVYRRGRPPLSVAGRPVIVVDDGIATGGTAEAAVRSLANQGASRVTLAVPVAPAETLRRLASIADEVVVVATPEPFRAVGQWYERFPQLSDADVMAALAEAA